MSKVSVIVPCYKQAEYLPIALHSLQIQTYPVEIIVVNDKSPDNTTEVAKAHGVTVIEHEVNRGLAAARNTGIKAAHGEYILCLDADDRLSASCIEELMAHAAPETIVIPGLQTWGETDVESAACPPFTKETLLHSNRIHCASLYPKAMWEKVGGYDESEIMRTGYEDWDFWLRMIVAGCTAIPLTGKMFWYRIRPDSMVRSITPEQHTTLHNYIKSKHS